MNIKNVENQKVQQAIGEKIGEYEKDIDSKKKTPILDMTKDQLAEHFKHIQNANLDNYKELTKKYENLSKYQQYVQPQEDLLNVKELGESKEFIAPMKKETEKIEE